MTNLTNNTKRKKTKKGIIFDRKIRFVPERDDQRSLDADTLRKKEGTSEVINPTVFSNPERY